MRNIPVNDTEVKKIASALRRKYREDMDRLWRDRNLHVDAQRRLFPTKRILEAVAAAHGVTVDDLRRWDRTVSLCDARHHAVWELRRRRIDLGLQQIAAEVNRLDHTTALHSYRVFCKYVAAGRFAGERAAVAKALDDVTC